MKTVIKESQLNEFAENLYIEQKDLFIASFTKDLSNRIKSGKVQFKNGEYMDFSKFKTKFKNEYLNS